MDSRSIIAAVLEATDEELRRLEAERIAESKPAWTKRERQLAYAVAFARHFGSLLAAALEPDFPGMRSGEIPSQAVGAVKRVDVSFSTPEAGLGFAISLKSVHFGERADGNSHFTHNMKRNDEELRVEATSHHLRQPYAVLVAVLFLPTQAFEDRTRTSSFATWVEHLWPLKGRAEPDDPPDRFELVFIALYARDRTELVFYEVGGDVPCPRKGRPRRLLTFEEVVRKIRRTYDQRNGRDFAFEGEESP